MQPVNPFPSSTKRGERPLWMRLLDETHAMIRQEGSIHLRTPVDEVIRQMREERDEQILSNLLRTTDDLEGDALCTEP